MKKFNGHRCERRNLTDLVLGTGPDGKRRAKPKAKKRPRNYTTDPTDISVPQRFYGGPNENPIPTGGSGPPPPSANPGGGDEKMINPGQFGEAYRKFFEEEGKEAMYSAFGQSAGQYVSGQFAGEKPTDGYSFGEGAGDFISGATNPLAMSLGPIGMLAFGAGNVAKGLYEEKRDLKEYREMQEEEKAARMRMAETATQNFNNQAFADYNQSGNDGQMYRHGGHITKFFTGGPSTPETTAGTSQPVTISPELQKYIALQQQTALLNPELAAARANMQPRKDKLYNYTDEELARNERVGQALADERAKENVIDGARRVKDATVYALQNPDVAADVAQLGLQGVAASEIPVVSQAAGLINTLGYTGRAGYKAYKGDYGSAAMYGTLAGLSGLGMVPVLGTAADLTAAEIAANTFISNASRGRQILSSPAVQRTIHGAEHVEHVIHPYVSADKAINVGTGGAFKPTYTAMGKNYREGGPVDYETEKSEVILASPNDKPVAVGQGRYTQISENLFKGGGPSHEQGGIPTRGATKEFVDAGGQVQDSPYVFSDAKEMRFDASDILSMIR